jgi:hypothetical protein
MEAFGPIDWMALLALAQQYGPMFWAALQAAWKVIHPTPPTP